MELILLLCLGGRSPGRGPGPAHSDVSWGCVSHVLYALQWKMCLLFCAIMQLAC